MDLHISIVTILVLILQAFSGVRLQESTVTSAPPPVPIETEEPEGNSDTDLSLTFSGMGDTGDMDSNNSTVLTTTVTPNDGIPGLPETTTPKAAHPANDLNTTENLTSTTTLPATSVAPTVIPTVLTTFVSNDTGASNTSQPDVPSATEISPVDPSSNGTVDEPNATVTDAPQRHPSAQPTTEFAPTPTVTTSTPTSTAEVPNTTIKAGASGNNSDRGLSPGVKRRGNGDAWGAIIGTALAVGFVGFIIYILLKKKGRREFMHRKLIEDMPPDPVHRLDNGEPLDLKFDGSAYYNPGLQGDNIQMTSFPQGQMH
ncbi:mucin-15 [Megalops cyprinoides]|uniref:mucin-15 n=1 Tax=Megalops cyprinoides TaxID=118141 RepID=UPI0018644599|nr:mucin-15 [Megalops cyprinoides]